MAVTSASRSAVVFARRALAMSAAAAVALLAFAVPASAHTGTPEAGCDEQTGTTTLEVKLSYYNGQGPNSIVVTDGEDVLFEDEDFGTSLDESWELAGDVAHQFRVEVSAHDDTNPEDEHQWSFVWEKTVEACVEEEQPPSSSSSSQTTTTTTTTVAESVAPTPTTTTTLAVGANANLAETGASIALPLGIGALLLVGGAVMLLVLRKRKA